MICGVDEAGRGPVIGPLVVGGVCVADDAPLREMGVRDSKKCTPKKREELASKILCVAKCETVLLPAVEIDMLRGEMTLNRIEAKLFATIIERLGPDTAFVDSADASESRFCRMVAAELGKPVRIVSEHKADETYPVVSAASIIAKVRRDVEIATIEREIGEPIGSGYPSDPVTISFIEKWINKNGSLPPHTRSSWNTIARLRSRQGGRKLEEWTK